MTYIFMLFIFITPTLIRLSLLIKLSCWTIIQKVPSYFLMCSFFALFQLFSPLFRFLFHLSFTVLYTISDCLGISLLEGGSPPSFTFSRKLLPHKNLFSTVVQVFSPFIADTRVSCHFYRV